MLASKLLLLSALSLLTLADQQILNENDASNPLTPEIDNLIEQLLELYHVPGLSIAVIDNGNIASKGYGISNFPSTNATADTLYFTGSTTKAFTATAAGLLVSDNDKYPNLTWSTPLHDILPKDFALSRPYETTHTTLEDALSHRTNLARHDLSYGWDNATLKATIQTLRHLPLTGEPRTRFQYNNLMYGTIGHSIESLTGEPLATFLTKIIYKPLNMLSTFFTLSTVLSFLSKNPDRSLARGYFYHPNGYYIPEPYIDVTPIAGAGATMSTVNDYAKWINTWLTAAAQRRTDAESKSTSKSSPITYDLIASLQSPRTFVPALPPSTSVDALSFLSPPTYALGWFGATSHSLGLPGPTRRLTFHGGGLPGFGTELYMLLDEAFGVVSMGNTAGSSNLVGSVIFYALYKQRFGKSEDNNLDVNVLVNEAETWLQWTESMREVYGIRATQKVAQEAETIDSTLMKSRSDITDSSPDDSLEAASGIYTHPAYGNITVTVEYSWLRVTPSARTLLWEVLLARLENRGVPSPSGVFVTSIRFGSGAIRDDPVPGFDPSCDGELCRFDTYWQHVVQGLAYLEASCEEGFSIGRIGIELDIEMVLAARRDRKSPDAWTKGMIWFERVV